MAAGVHQFARNNAVVKDAGRAVEILEKEVECGDAVREAALDLYDLAVLDAALADTVFAGKLHFAAVTDSTNSDAQAAARARREELGLGLI